MTGSIEAAGSSAISSAQESLGVESTTGVSPDDDVGQTTETQQTSTEVEQQKADDGGCMKMFKMIVQIVCAVVAVACPAAAPIAMAVAAGVSKLDDGSTEANSADSGGVDMDNIAGYRKTAEEALESWGDYDSPNPAFSIG